MLSNNYFIEKINKLFSKEKKKNILFLIFLMFIGMIVETLSIGLIFPVLTLISDPDLILKYDIVKSFYNYFGFGQYESFIFVCLFVLLIVFFIKALFMFFLSWKQNYFTFNYEADLCKNLYKIYLLKPYLFHTENNSSKLVQNFVVDSGILTYNIILPFLRLITESLIIFGLICLLLFIEFKISLIVISSLITLIVIYYFFIKDKVQKWGNERERLDGLRIKHLQQSFAALKEIKVMNKEIFFKNIFNEFNDSLAKYNRYQNTLLTFPYIGFEFIAVFSMVFFIFLLILKGSVMSSIIPILGLFAGVGFRLVPSMNRVIMALQLIKFGKPALEKLSQEINYEKEFINPYENKDIKDFNNIKIKDLSFKYKNKNFNIFENVTLSLNKKDIIGIYGESGSGKSTFVDIVLGLIKPDKGSIYIDDLKVDNLHKNFSGRIAYVPQQVNLLDDTLENNITLDDKHNDNEATFNKVVEYTNLQEVLNSLPEGKKSFIGERGVKLSGGQRQRIGIARALYFKPDILVLDESTNSLDKETEKLVLNNIKNIEFLKLILIISHSENGLFICNKFLKLENGKIDYRNKTIN